MRDVHTLDWENMLRKLQILSAMIHLKTFNVGQLARAARVSRMLASSTLNRCPQEWLIPLSGAGFEKMYQISLIGFRSIENELSRDTVVTASVLHDAEMIDELIPLMAIKAKAAKMSNANEEIAQALRLQIEGNLRWAEARLRHSPNLLNNLKWEKAIDEIRTNLHLSKN